MKKLFSLAFAFAFSFGLFAMPSLAAVECFDQDSDGFFAATADNQTEVETDCSTRFSYKGTEIPICDCPSIDTRDPDDAKIPGCTNGANEANIDTIIDRGKIKKLLKGRNFNPNAIDAPNDLIDQNCDGSDGEFIESTDDRSVNDLLNVGINWLTSIVASISVIIMIWGGIMYATAAGEEEKTKKARKAMVGAVVGLLIALLAKVIVSYVVTQFV